MTQSTLKYKGYQGTIDVNRKDYSLYGRILFIPQEIIYRGNSYAELNEHFQRMVDDYLRKRHHQPVTTESR